MKESPFWRVKLSYGRVEQLPRSLTTREMRQLLFQARRNYLEIITQQSESSAQDGTFVQVLSHTYRALRDLALVEFLFATGMRVGEASSLNMRDFMVKEMVFMVRGKGERSTGFYH